MCQIESKWGEDLTIILKIDNVIVDTFNPIGDELLEMLFKFEIMEYNRYKNLNKLLEN